MKRFLFAFILVLAVWSPLAAQTAIPPDSIIFAPLTSVYSEEFILTYPQEISVLWDRWAAIGAQIDTIWIERKTPLGWMKVRTYNELLGTQDTILVKARPIDVLNPVHAIPSTFRLATGGKQNDTIKVFLR